MEEQDKHYVYMLRCKDGTLYTGYTTNLKKRVMMHELGKGAKYTRGRGPFQVVFCQSFVTKQEAMKTEYKIKQLNRKEKEQLINTPEGRV